MFTVLNQELDQKLLKKIDRFLKLRPRSIKELRDYLHFRRQINISQVDKYLQYYEDMGFISDERFCEWFLLNRLHNSKYGLERIKQELLQKGISKDLYINTIDRLGREKIEIENFSKLVQQLEKIGNNQSKLDPVKDNSIISKLIRQGFSYEEIKKAWNN